MLSRAQSTFHHNPRLRGPVSSVVKVWGEGRFALSSNSVCMAKLV